MNIEKGTFLRVTTAILNLIQVENYDSAKEDKKAPRRNSKFLLYNP
jgi:hypothetical protein